MPINQNKINNLVNNIIENHDIDWANVLNIDDDIQKKLYDYQVCDLCSMLQLFQYENIIVNGSETGTGKTYVSCALIKQTNYRAVIFCSKLMISYWNSVSKYFNIKPLFIINYEAIIEGKYCENGKLVKCPYLNISDNKTFKWSLKNDTIFIFDEAHRCKNYKSLHGKLLMSVKNVGKTVLLSATLSAVPKDFVVFGYMLGFYSSISHGSKWINSLINQDNRAIIKPLTSSLTKKLYPNKGTKMSIAELGEAFPKNNIFPLLVDLDSSSVHEYNNFLTLKKNKISDIIKIRMKLEYLKIPTFAELVQDYICNGYSVVVFLNFTESVVHLAKLLKTKNILNGQTKHSDREKLISDFQNNTINLLICNSQVGGESISLHDLHGKPRVSLISNSFSGIELKQILGRIHRVGSLTPALQYIVFFSNTLENDIYELVKHKLQFIDKLNEDELIELEMF